MPFKDIPYLQLWQTACLAEQNHLLDNFVREHYEEHFCDNVWHLVPVLFDIILVSHFISTCRNTHPTSLFS